MLTFLKVSSSLLSKLRHLSKVPPDLTLKTTSINKKDTFKLALENYQFEGLQDLYSLVTVFSNKCYQETGKFKETTKAHLLRTVSKVIFLFIKLNFDKIWQII